ncbi:putative reverse transcriptase domain-containing protein [Tanacetum coccineum]
MPLRAMTQAAIEKLFSDRVAAALSKDHATRGNINGAGGPGGNIGENAGGQGRKLQAKAERIAESNKRKWENNNNNNNNQRNYRNNNRHNQNNNQRHGNARALNTTQNAGANQTGVASKCNRCGICHFGQCPPKCYNCGKMGHKEKDCRSKNVASGTNT